MNQEEQKSILLINLLKFTGSSGNKADEFTGGSYESIAKSEIF